MKHGLTTRVLHLLLAGAVLMQLTDTQFMRVPRPGRVTTPVEAAALTTHEYVGLTAMAIVAMFWIWLTVRRVGTSPSRLFPWFSAQRRRELWADIALHIQAARRLAIPDPERSESLAAAVHGLGLLIILIMAVTGTVGWLSWDGTSAMSDFTHNLFEIHGLVANLVWAYVIVHVGIAVLHEIVGHRLLRRMNPLPL